MRSFSGCCRSEAKDLEAEWKAAKNERGANDVATLAAEDAWNAKAREARQALAKAGTIETAACDLKAVNPNRVTVEDRRTAAEFAGGD